nr:hypothetical protein CFP56_79627 [Quercus suber]
MYEAQQAKGTECFIKPSVAITQPTKHLKDKLPSSASVSFWSSATPFLKGRRLDLPLRVVPTADAVPT